MRSSVVKCLVVPMSAADEASRRASKIGGDRAQLINQEATFTAISATCFVVLVTSLMRGAIG